MNKAPESPYKRQFSSAENQPPVLTPEQIPSGYVQRESGLLVKKNTIGNIAAYTAEHMDPLHEVKEILNDQKTEVRAGYAKFAEDLGVEALDEQEYDRTLAFSLKKWEADGSLGYLRNWLEENPEQKIYLSASPNRIIPRGKLREAIEKFILINSGASQENVTDWVFLYKYKDEEIWGTPKQDESGNDLPVQLAVWTDIRNLDAAPLPTQRARIKELQRFYGSASDQTIPQTIGHWYRLRESEDLGGVGIVRDNFFIASGEQLFAELKDGSVPSADIGVAGSRDLAIWPANFAESKDCPVESRFIITS